MNVFKKIVLITLIACGAVNAAAPLIWDSGEYGKFLTSLGFKFNDDKQIRTLTVDPSAGAGISAPVGSIGLRANAGAGEGWFKIGAGDTAWTNFLTAATGWSFLGNSGTVAGTNFIGTTDAVDLVLKTDATERFRITSSGGYDTTLVAGVLHSDASGILTSSGVVSSDITNGTIVNDDVNAGAAIAYSKLNLATSIVNADISGSAAIADTKLDTIATAGKVSNSATTATDANTASAIVARDASGNFTAGTITAALSGNASTSTALAANPTDCGSDTYATTIAANGNLTCASITNASTTATASNTNSTIVLRDGSGNFAAGTITATLSGNSSTATALAANPTDCAGGEFANAIDASGNLTCATPAGGGDVTGPAASVDNELVLFSGTTGKIIKRASGNGAVSVSSGVVTQGTLSLANGGTNGTDAAVNGGIVYSDADSMEISAAGTSGQILTSAGAASPTWETPTITTPGAAVKSVAALITCSSSSSVGSQSGTSWISVANISGSRCALTFTGFTATPWCTANLASTDTTRLYSVQIATSSSSAGSIGMTFINSGSATVNQGANDSFMITCIGTR